MNSNMRSRMLDRLRREDATTTVSATWPQLFLGDFETAKTVTLGVDPAGKGVKFQQEGADRSAAGEETLDQILSASAGAFQGALTPWFQQHEEVLQGMGLSYAKGEVAHLDLVQEKLIQPWADWHGLNPFAADELLRRDLTFVNWELEAFPIETALCTSRLVLDNMLPKVGGRVVAQGSVDKLRWMIAMGTAAGRPIALVGWNVYLVRMDHWKPKDRIQLGKVLRAALEEARES